MAECILYNGGMFNNDYLTAKPEDVKYGQTFIGAGTENTQEGTMPTYYNVGISCFNVIETKYPSGIENFPLMGNVFVGGISGISSAVIKKGVKIGPYIGTFEGWVD